MDRCVSRNYNLLGRKHTSGHSVSRPLISLGTGKKAAYLSLLPFLILVVAYEFLPLVQLVIGSFQDKVSGGFSLSNYSKVLTTPLYQVSIWNSVRISLISAFVGIIVAFLAAKAYQEAGAKFRRGFTMILNMTSNFAGVPLTFAFMILMGNTGVLTLIGKQFHIAWLGDFNLYSGAGLLLIYIYFQIPLAVLLLMPAFVGLRKEWQEAAVILKASEMQYWMRIAIPNLLPGILGTVSVLFANALAAYGTAYALIMSNYALLAIQISAKFKGDVRIDKQLGGALAVVLIVLMVAATMLNNYIIHKNTKGRVLV